MKRRCCLLLALLFCLGFLHAQNTIPVKPIGAENPPFSLDELQKRHFQYFWVLTDTHNWQVPDRWPTPSFSSIAATGFGLSSYLVGAERGWITRQQAAERVLNTLKVLKELPQGPQMKGVAGYRGFFYHFLDAKTALRYENVELSSIDTGLLMAGVLSCMSYFDANDPIEKEIRDTADFLYRRVEFDWYLNEQNRMSMGWFPDRGFLGADWRGYNEAMVLLVMAMGSPTHPAPAAMWDKWCEPYFRATYKGQDMVNFGPLFGHQYSHCWIDFKGIKDPYMQAMGIDYFENSRRATLSNRQYCIDNPHGFMGYSDNIWGLTAGDGPGYAEQEYNGKKMTFDGYSARGAAIDYGVDDGTIAPTAALSSMPFTPEYSLPAAEAMWKRWPVGPYGFYDGYNESYTWPSSNGQKNLPFWVDVDYLGIDQGPIVLMIENYRSGFLWNLMKKNPYFIKGLQKAGFKGGWLDAAPKPAATPEKTAKPNPDVPVEPRGYFKRAIYTDTAGNKLPYELMEPWKAQKGQKYPLVIFLHGSGERGSDNAGQMRNGVFAFTEKTTREKHPCFLLVPQCPENELWGGVSRDWEDVSFSDANYYTPERQVIELIDKMLRENPNIDKKRVYITGLSMGGYGTFDILTRRPDLFAAGMPLCGGGDPKYAAKIKNIPLWVFHGRLDEAVYPKYSTDMVAALRKLGSKVKYTEFSTMNHNIWDIVYYNPANLDWLFAQRKP